MKIAKNHKSHKPNEFCTITKRKGFFILNRNTTGDLAQLTNFFGLSKVKGWTPLIKYKIKKNRTINCNQPKVSVQTKLLTNFSMSLQILFFNVTSI